MGLANLARWFASWGQTMNRMHGLDVARYLALVGMVIVNFDVVMVAPAAQEAGWLAALLQGKAAALFVVLAGVGFGLANTNKAWSQSIQVTSKRFVFLLILGLINAMVFQADIIHFYAFYFLFAMLMLPLSTAILILIMVGLLVDSVLMIMLFDYDLGWDWANYHYEDFWTLAGFFRNLFFNGWHPVIPWLAFLVLGMVLSRLSLQHRQTQIKLVVIGTLVFMATTALSQYLLAGMEKQSEWAALLTTQPIPPMPLYMVAAAGCAMAVIGLCLILAPKLSQWRLLPWLTAAGRQTLTWYLLHIFLGMGVLEAVNRLGNQSPQQALVASLSFCLLMTIAAHWINHKFQRGPVEALMRKMTQ